MEEWLIVHHLLLGLSEEKKKIEVEINVSVIASLIFFFIDNRVKSYAFYLKPHKSIFFMLLMNQKTMCNVLWPATLVLVQSRHSHQPRFQLHQAAVFQSKKL